MDRADPAYAQAAALLIARGAKRAVASLVASLMERRRMCSQGPRAGDDGVRVWNGGGVRGEPPALGEISVVADLPAAGDESLHKLAALAGQVRMRSRICLNCMSAVLFAAVRLFNVEPPNTA